MPLFLGFLGVLGFSGSLPATRVAVEELDASFVGLGRAVVAAALGGALLLVTHRRGPSARSSVGWRSWRSAW